MYRRILASLFAEYLVRSVGENFIDVHVVRRSGSRLKNVDDELVAMFSGKDFIRCLYDCVSELRVEPPCFLVSQGCRPLDPNYCIDECRQRLDAADWKILNGSHGLHAVQCVGRDLELSERIFLDARFVSHFRALRIYEEAARTSRAVPLRKGLDIRSSPIVELS